MRANRNKISLLAKRVQNDPEDTFSKFALALELLKTDDVKKARMMFESILKQDPEYLGVYYHLGKLYESLGMYDDALRLFRNGIDVADNKQEFRTKSELKEAIEQLRYKMDD